MCGISTINRADAIIPFKRQNKISEGQFEATRLQVRKDNLADQPPYNLLNQ